MEFRYVLKVLEMCVGLKLCC